jgi:hypothetical protein
MKELFKRLITDFMERPLPLAMEREYEIPLQSKKIISLTGVRRSGKTFLLYSLIRKIREKIPKEHVLYINFEDDRLYAIQLGNLDELIQSYYELYPENRDHEIYLFLDEIQNVPGWEKFVRRLYDTLPIQIFITGSSSKLLGSEIAGSLRGRTLTYEIFPFSFSEYVRYKEITVNLNSSRSLSYLKKSFTEYMVNGGFAEVFDEPPSIQRRIVSDYLELIIYRDIVERYAIQNSSLLKEFIAQLFSRISLPFSVNKTYNDFKSRGYRVAKDTLYDYLVYLEDSFAMFPVSLYSDSIREQQRNPRKIYTVDTAFKMLFEYPGKEDYGHVFENMAYLQLRRKTRNIFYYKGKQEADFIVNNDGKIDIINVCYSLVDKNTRDREIRGLIEAMDRLGEKSALLLTMEEEDVLTFENKKIHVAPMFKWLLG